MIKYRILGHEVRVWTEKMEEFGQFEVVDKRQWDEFLPLFISIFGPSSAVELGIHDMYEPGDCLG